MTGDATYNEPLRPQFHFSCQRGWLNDPNGLAFYNGEYHLFFQHYPHGIEWNHQMHWGHAVSADMVHWRELEIALYPDELGPMYSGSAVVDWENTSGFGAPGKPQMVLIYTAAGKPATQCLAHSLDGRAFTKFDGNPVVPSITAGNRDPKVFWHAPSRSWVMALYVELPPKVHTTHFLTSPNLKNWTIASRIESFYECPELIRLDNDRCVLTGAPDEYFVGTFDGRAFTPSTPALRGNYGNCFYAAQTFGELPKGDTRRIQIGWLRAQSPGMEFNQCMSVPMELSLIDTSDGPRLRRRPIRELQTLRRNSRALGDEIEGDCVEIEAEFTPREGSVVEFILRGVSVRFDARDQTIRTGQCTAPAWLAPNGSQRMTILLDHTCMEIFAGDGLTYIPIAIIPAHHDRSIRMQTSDNVRFDRLVVHEMKSIWH